MEAGGGALRMGGVRMSGSSTPVVYRTALPVGAAGTGATSSSTPATSQTSTPGVGRTGGSSLGAATGATGGQPVGSAVAQAAAMLGMTLTGNPVAVQGSAHVAVGGGVAAAAPAGAPAARPRAWPNEVPAHGTQGPPLPESGAWPSVVTPESRSLNAPAAIPSNAPPTINVTSLSGSLRSEASSATTLAPSNLKLIDDAVAKENRSPPVQYRQPSQAPVPTVVPDAPRPSGPPALSFNQASLLQSNDDSGQHLEHVTLAEMVAMQNRHQWRPTEAPQAVAPATGLVASGQVASHPSSPQETQQASRAMPSSVFASSVPAAERSTSPALRPSHTSVHHIGQDVEAPSAPSAPSVQRDVEETETRLSDLMTTLNEQFVRDRIDTMNNHVKLCMALEKRLVARISEEVDGLRSEMRSLSRSDVAARATSTPTEPEFRSAPHPHTPPVSVNGSTGESTGEQCAEDLSMWCRIEPRATQWLNNITEHVLQTVQADESLQRLRKQYDSVQSTLQDLAHRLETSTGQPTVNSRDLAALQDTVHESVKLNRSLGLELRQQRLQRLQENNSITTRMEALEKSVSDICQIEKEPTRFAFPTSADATPQSQDAIQLGSAEYVPECETASVPASPADSLENTVARLQELVTCCKDMHQDLSSPMSVIQRKLSNELPKEMLDSREDRTTEPLSFMLPVSPSSLAV